jgi:hypothetical protein
MGYPIITKIKYNDFRISLQNKGLDINTIESVIDSFCNVFHFDENMNTYCPKYHETNKVRLAKIKEETGLSTYQICNRSEYYHKHKAVINAKRSENRRQAKLLKD